MKVIKAGSTRRGFLQAVICSATGLALVFILGPGFAAAEDGQKKWDALSDSEKAEIKKNWTEFKALSPAEKSEYRNTLAKYQAMPEAQKQLVQENYAHWKTLPADRQAGVLEKFAKWKELSEEEKKKIRGDTPAVDVAK